MNIKKIYTIAALLSLTAGTAYAQAPVVVTGLLKKETGKPVKLFKVEEGRSVEIASSKATPKGNFGFKFYPEYEGFYVIGTGDAGNPGNNYKFYFKGGEQLSLSILDSSYVLTGKLNSRENQVLAQWHDLVMPIEDKSINFMRHNSTFVDFFPQLEEIAAKSGTFLKGKETGNTRFDRAMKQNIAWDMAGYASNFLFTPRSAHPSLEEHSPYYAKLKAQDFAGATRTVYTQPWGMRTLGGVLNLNFMQNKIKFLPGPDGLKNTFNLIPNDTLKGDFLLNKAAESKTF